MYHKLIKPLLFRFDPEAVHYFTFSLIKILSTIPLAKTIIRVLYQVKDVRLERKVFGLTFPNPVGLAAGFDKNALL